MKSKLCAAILIIMLLVSFTSCKATSNDTTENITGAASPASMALYYKDFDKLSLASDSIVIGEITQVAHQKENTARTYYVFVISQKLKGEVGDVILLVDYFIPLPKVGEQYVLFIKLSPTGTFYILGADQGRYKLVDDKVYSMDFIAPASISETDGYIPPVPPELQINGISKQDFIKIILETLKNTSLPAS